MKFLVTLKNSNEKFLVRETKDSLNNKTRGLTDTDRYTLKDFNSKLYRADDLNFICLVFPESLVQFKLNLLVGKPISFIDSTLEFFFGKEPETEHNIEKNCQTKIDFYEPINKNLYPKYEIFAPLKREIKTFCNCKNMIQIKNVADKQNEGFKYTISDLKYYYPKVYRRNGNLIINEPKTIISRG